MQINKGNSDLYSRTDQINDLIKKHNPKIIIINKLNYKYGDTVAARTGILLHKDVHYSRRRDLETPGISSVWVKLSYPGRKPILVQGFYRQFRRIGKPNSHTPASQHQRWEMFIKKWEKAMQEDLEIISMGDTNLNYFRWNISNQDMNSYDITNRPMSNALQNRILDKGVNLINTTPTRELDTPQTKPSCLDMMFANKMDKIANFQSGLPGFSDHTVQILVRKTKKNGNHPKFHQDKIIQKL